VSLEVIWGMSAITLPKSVGSHLGNPRLEIMRSAIKLTLTLWDVFRPRSIAERQTIERINTVVIPLGPYRNLTTLTAAIFALHPECIVLNHAGYRLQNIRRLDFVRYPEPGKIRRFIDASVALAQTGRRGDFGGNILKAHAFDSKNLSDAYKSRYGNKILKENTHVLFWKESMLISNRIEKYDTNIGDIIEAGRQENVKVHFIMPIRHPIDCANSNLKGHYKHLTNECKFPLVLERVIEEILRFHIIKSQFPQNSFWFREIDLNRLLLRNLCTDLGMTHDQIWEDAALDNMNIHERKRSSSDYQIYWNVLTKLCRDDAKLRDWLQEMN